VSGAIIFPLATQAAPTLFPGLPTRTRSALALGSDGAGRANSRPPPAAAPIIERCRERTRATLHIPLATFNTVLGVVR
jgi:hypothetical protein